jgi:hypothetical protein
LNSEVEVRASFGLVNSDGSIEQEFDVFAAANVALRDAYKLANISALQVGNSFIILADHFSQQESDWQLMLIDIDDQSGNVMQRVF